ncbi:hypothetical protein FRE64_14130 [Euhalothece natronophila Z-M001]|uniref:Uncharacterized protein n=1 Tax=Euhalothece natronophila Z-M001 TaxID=522448 RepID=A0A5B8NPP7_9CHRO|nr:hypothetical protein [Euhalothece natronophila]QDZ40977.1 hypothetical protein FRE64_14130 [Euhalothece natronophila Z-M001]
MGVKLYLGEAVGLLLKTLPFIWIRLGTYALLGLGLSIYFAVAAGVAWLLGQVLGILGVIVFLAAFGGAWALVRWAKRYFFYLLQAAHIAVMTEYIVYGRAPEGSQVQYGRRQVMDRFRDVSLMFAVDLMIDGIVKRINRTVASITGLLPIPNLDNLNKIIAQVSKFATTYIDEAILSRAYQYREKNVWAVAQDGIILYAQAWKPVLANAVALTIINYLEMAVVLVILAIPAIILGAIIPFEPVRVFLGLLVLVGTWMFKLAVSDAYAMAATLLAYHRSIEGVEPNPDWKERLEGMSDQFRQLTDRASSAVAGKETASGEPESSESDPATSNEGSETDPSSTDKNPES